MAHQEAELAERHASVAEGLSEMAEETEEKLEDTEEFIDEAEEWVVLAGTAMSFLFLGVGVFAYGEYKKWMVYKEALARYYLRARAASENPQTGGENVQGPPGSATAAS